MRNEALAARNAVSWAQARALADGAIHRTVFELLRPKVSPDVWAADGSVHVWDAMTAPHRGQRHRRVW